MFFAELIIIDQEFNNDSMKTIEEMKSKVYDEVLNSGYFRTKQAQIKTHVYELVEKQYNSGRNKIDFQYEHPLLAKIKKYPLTSLCVDLIQQFLESFKFKHTLNVFKKEINRSINMNRSHLSQSFKIQIKNPESQAVLLSLVQQMVSGDIGAVKNDIKINNYTQNEKKVDRDNNFMKKPEKSNIQSKAQTQTHEKSSLDSSSFNNKSQDNVQNSSSNINTSNINATNSNSNQSSSNVKEDSYQSSSIKGDTSKEESSVVEEQKPKEKGKKGKEQKVKVQKQKPPEEASDLLGDVMKKFQATTKQSKQQEKKTIFESKRAYSEEKQQKVVDPSESGANKIRGVSLGKNVPSFMSKFMNQPPAPPQKNESFIDEQLDQFQQSKDSTRRNPLFSSSESGFDKSGFDQSVDSSAIQEYQYVQRARKFTKKP